MLQARLFSYPDTHRHRLGANYQQIPVNAPINMNATANNFQRDGPMTVTNNGGGAPNYFPNVFQGPRPEKLHKWHSDTVTGDVERVETGNEDNYSQCRHFFNKVLSEEERERLTSNIAGHLENASEMIRVRAISNFACVDPRYGKMIHDKVQILLKENGGVVGDRKRKVAPLNPPRDVPVAQSSGCPYGFKASKL